MFENLSKNFAKPKFEETDLYKKFFEKVLKDEYDADDDAARASVV